MEDIHLHQILAKSIDLYQPWPETAKSLVQLSRPGNHRHLPQLQDVSLVLAIGTETSLALNLN